jgi:NADP-dependent 3-hydroxy acid dehydrogenase YdfG
VVAPGTVNTELLTHLSDITRDVARRQVDQIEALRPEDIADAIGYIVTRERRVAVNEMLVRATDQTW